jgi:hypothetical protein
MLIKACTKCGEVKDISHYSKKCSKTGRLDAQCKPCVVKRGQAWYQKNKDRAIETRTRWYEENKERAREKAAEYYQKNYEATRNRHKEWAAQNPEKGREYSRKWQQANMEISRKMASDHRKSNLARYAARAATRRAEKLKATPAWGNQFFVAEAYALAKLRTEKFGFRWEVDHIVPLKADLVCGLHWEGNLRVITCRENRMKSNVFWPDMP